MLVTSGQLRMRKVFGIAKGRIAVGDERDVDGHATSGSGCRGCALRAGIVCFQIQNSPHAFMESLFELRVASIEFVEFEVAFALFVDGF